MFRVCLQCTKAQGARAITFSYLQEIGDGYSFLKEMSSNRNSPAPTPVSLNRMYVMPFGMANVFSSVTHSEVLAVFSVI
jgi:hypothetical protein